MKQTSVIGNPFDQLNSLMWDEINCIDVRCTERRDDYISLYCNKAGLPPFTISMRGNVIMLPGEGFKDAYIIECTLSLYINLEPTTSVWVGCLEFVNELSFKSRISKLYAMKVKVGSTYAKVIVDMKAEYSGNFEYFVNGTFLYDWEMDVGLFASELEKLQLA